MHAFLFVNPKDSNIEDKARELQSKLLSLNLQKVEDAKEISRLTKLKLQEKTVIVLKDFDKASDEAQNAFLKSLEEPQENLFFVLTAANLDRVLETIISRCEVVEFENLNLKLNSNDEEEISRFLKSELGEKFSNISKINKREEAIEFIQKIIMMGHKNITTNFKNVELALKTLRSLESNGNVQLQLTNFVINLS